MLDRSQFYLTRQSEKTLSIASQMQQMMRSMRLYEKLMPLASSIDFLMELILMLELLVVNSLEGRNNELHWLEHL